MAGTAGAMPLDTILDGRYRLGTPLGRGAWAVVYRAHQIDTGRSVAVKILEPDARHSVDAVCRALREARLVAGLHHPNIVHVTDFGHVDGRPYIVMEQIEGPSLGQVLRRHGPLDPALGTTVFLHLARALSCAHRHGIVHRDLKPGNVLLGEDEHGVLYATLTDFGVAATWASDLTQEGTVLGTPAYMAPEQARGHTVDGRADLYGLGAVMYRVFTGRKPFEAPDALSMAICHLTEALPSFAEVAPGRDIPPHLEAIVRRCMAKAPQDRFASADELVEVLADPEAFDMDSTLEGAARRIDRGISGVILGSCLGLFLSLAVVGFTWWATTAPPEAPEADAVAPDPPHAMPRRAS